MGRDRRDHLLCGWPLIRGGGKKVGLSIAVVATAVVVTAVVVGALVVWRIRKDRQKLAAQRFSTAFWSWPEATKSHVQ